ncbi:MAG TPA: cobalamin-independent methionine synthase II family protein, partial [Thermoleophilaceae bacterium]|nr:cobalamin-independent methionine synthase II family protein [Thermoleophilaceae bacterium]
MEGEAIAERITSRVEAVGSMLRSDQLREARDAHAAGTISPAEFKRVEDAEVDRAVAIQEAAGLDVVTDGEFRRGHFTGSLSEAVSGLGDVPAAGHDWHGEDDMQYAHQRAITGKLRRSRSLAQEEFVYLRARTGKPVKITLPSPLMMQTFWSDEHSTGAYADPFEMFADAAVLVREEIEALAALGCRYVQIDAPELATLVDDSVRAASARRGIDPERMLTEGIEILDTVTGVPGVRYGIHLCRGNRDGHWQAEGGYERIAEQLFAHVDGFDAFFLEYDDDRSGGFEPLAGLPDDKLVVLGLISTKRPELEDAEQLVARVHEAAEHHPFDALGISPQCGFESAIGNYPLDEAQQEAKLR